MYFRFSIIVIFLQFSGVFSEDVTLKCSYRVTGNNYVCLMQEFSYTNTSKIVGIEGDHAINKTDNDVNTVFFNGFNGFLYTIPSEIFAKFKKIEIFQVPSVVLLQEIKILQNCDELKEFSVVSLLKMEANSFKNCLKLQQLNILYSLFFKLPEGMYIPSLTSLIISSANITQLSGNTFNGLENLKTLDLNPNPIERIENGAFNKLAKLESLRFSMKKLTFLPKNLLEPLKNLKELTILDTLPEYSLSIEFLQFVKELRNLKILQLPGIQNGGIPTDFLNNFVNLEFLDLKNNAIKCTFQSCLSFSHLRELYYLNLANNEIHDIDENTFKQLYFLEELYLNGNKIDVLRANLFKNMKILDTLNLANNSIVAVYQSAFVGLSRLEELDLSGNKIYEIENTTLNGLRSISKLNLTDNKISVIYPNTFRFLTKLTTLDLSKNTIRDLDKFAFYGLNNLKTLNLDNNVLTTILELNLDNLDTLYLRNNLITNIQNSQFSQKVIYLNNNKIKNIGLNTFRPSENRLTEIYFTNNQINSVHPRAFDSFTGTHKLNFEGNVCVFQNFYLSRWESNDDFKSNIKECFLNAMSNEVTAICDIFLNVYSCTANLVTFKDPKDFTLRVNHNALYSDADVTRLSFIDSSIPEVPSVVFQRFPNLIRLNLISTDLKVLNPINNCANLEILDMSNNNIEYVSDGVFQNCPNLLWIDLDNNQISTLSNSAFHNLPNMKVLYLNNNNLTEIKREFFVKSSLEFLYLANNRINSIQRGSFDDRLENNVATIDLSGNVCIEKKFVYPVIYRFHNDLENCYLNSGSDFIKIGSSLVFSIIFAVFGILRY